MKLERASDDVVGKCGRCRRRIRLVRMQEGDPLACDPEPERVVFVEARAQQETLFDGSEMPQVAGVVRFGFIPHACDRGRKR